MYSIRLEGETAALLRKMRRYSEIDRRSLNMALGEGVRESTLERFKEGRAPDGRRWKTSIRAATTEIYTLSLHDALPICSCIVSALKERPPHSSEKCGDTRK